MLLTKFKVSRSNYDVLVYVFSGQDGNTLLCNGCLLFGKDEWICLSKVLNQEASDNYRIEIENEQ